MILTGFGNVMLPRAAATFRDNDCQALLVELVKSTMMNITCMAVVAVGIIGIGPILIRLAYAGRYSQQPLTILIVLSVALIAKAVGMGANIGYWVLGRPQINTLTNVCGFFGMLLMTFSLKQPLGVLSIVWAVLLTDLIPGLVRWGTLLHLLSGTELNATVGLSPRAET